MRAFITGITGFAGSHLFEHLRASGDQVIGCQAEPVRGGLPKHDVEVFTWDLRGEPSTRLRETVAAFAPDCIYHLAALSVPGHCGLQEPTELAWQVNVEGTQRVLDLAAELPSRPRVLIVSSSYVYGPVDPIDNRRAEDAPLRPHRGYGRTKLAAEQLALQAVAANRADCVIARAFNHTGPRQTPNMMLPEWAQQFAADDRAPIAVHTLDAWLDLTDVSDVVRAYRLLMEKGETGGIYNVGSGVMRRSGDLFAHLHQLAGGDREYAETMPGARYQPIADCGRLRAATGWRPQVSLWSTIRETYHYWQQQCRRTNR